jgi:hypothetical protein
MEGVLPSWRKHVRRHVSNGRDAAMPQVVRSQAPSAIRAVQKQSRTDTYIEHRGGQAKLELVVFMRERADQHVDSIRETGIERVLI